MERSIRNTDQDHNDIFFSSLIFFNPLKYQFLPYLIISLHSLNQLFLRNAQGCTRQFRTLHQGQEGGSCRISQKIIGKEKPFFRRSKKKTKVLPFFISITIFDIYYFFLDRERLCLFKRNGESL